MAVYRAQGGESNEIELMTASDWISAAAEWADCADGRGDERAMRDAMGKARVYSNLANAAASLGLLSSGFAFLAPTTESAFDPESEEMVGNAEGGERAEGVRRAEEAGLDGQAPVAAAKAFYPENAAISARVQNYIEGAKARRKGEEYMIGSPEVWSEGHLWQEVRIVEAEVADKARGESSETQETL